MVLRLKKLVIRGFRSFASEATILFPDRGAVLIDGKNLDTGGSSGSGKSSVAMALAYAFGYCDIPATQLQSWQSDEELQVQVEFETAEGLAVLTRGKKLTLELAGGKIKGSAAAVETKLRELTGLGPDMLAALTYRAQKTPGLFLNKTDSEKKEFLTGLLGLEKYEAAIETSQQNMKGFEREMEVASALASKLAAVVNDRLAYMRANPLVFPGDYDGSIIIRLHEIQNYRNAYLVPNHQSWRDAEFLLRDNIAKQLAALEVQAQPGIEAAKKAVAEAKSAPVVAVGVEKWEKTLLEARERRARLENEDLSRATEHRDEANRIYDELRLAQSAPVKTFEATIADLNRKIVDLDKNLCFECGQTRVDAQKRKQEVLAEIEAAKKSLAGAQALHARIPALMARQQAHGVFVPNPKIAQMRDIESTLLANIQNAKNSAVTDHRNQIQALQNEVTRLEFEYSRKRAEVNDGYSADSSTLAKKVAEATGALARADLEIGSLQNRIAEQNRARAQYMAEQARRDKEVADLQADLDRAVVLAKEMEAKMASEKDFVKLIGREGFLGAIFDEVLAEISDETNRILGNLPNAAHVAIQFRSESLTQKGSAKKTIVPIIAINGHEAPLKSGCSGGMITSVELAVDLAVAAVVSRRTGTVPGWLILDESFDGLDLVTKESCMALLGQYAADRLVLVVDHASEFKESFTHVVNVVHKNGKSTIE